MAGKVGLGGMRCRTAGQAILFALTLSSVSGVASASESFPGTVLDYIQAKSPDVDCAVPCMLCHTKPQGGEGTARDKGFIENLRNVGVAVRKGDTKSVTAALAALEANRDCPTAPGAPCDSDEDGKTDMEELRLSRDPDGGRNFNDCLKYGCGASSIAPEPRRRTEPSALWLVAVLGAAAALRRSRVLRRS